MSGRSWGVALLSEAKSAEVVVAVVIGVDVDVVAVDDGVGGC